MYGVDFETLQAVGYVVMVLVLLDMVSLPVIAVTLMVRRFR